MKKILKYLAVALRFLMGIMWTMSGITWYSRTDAVGYLNNALTQALDRNLTYGFYQSFLRGHVLPNQELYTHLVSAGELLVGISVLTGTLTRVGAGGALFLLLNYAFMNGGLSDPFSLLFLAFHTYIFTQRPGRTLGVDGILHRINPFLLW